ncbi:MAG TPA: hypothetical protein VJW76_09245 [Verrucomicrobiae bacterium]|nr:hypothetical protein [Verrucomicrobiae bacterium]
MNRKESLELLDDVLGDAAPEDFRAALLDQTLRQVQRRRRVRRWNRGLAASAGLILVSVTCWKLFWPGPRLIESRAPALVVIHSRPLDPSMVVETKPGAVSMVVSSDSTFALVETGRSRSQFREIDDEGLLAFMHGKPVALVRHGPNQAELIFLNPEDEKGFQVEQ